MVATVALDGSHLFTSDAITNISTFKIAGAGGTPTAALADGGKGVTVTVNKTHIALMYDLGAGNELDFTGGGANEGEAISVKAEFLAKGILNTQSAGGFGIYIATSLNADYAEFYHYGSDNYSGGPKNLLQDPTLTASASSGTVNLASIRYVGVFANVGGTTARFDNLILYSADSYKGIIVSGTGTTSDMFADILADEATNKYGVVSPLNDENTALQVLGSINLGDNVGTTASTLTDKGSKLFLGAPKYHNATSVVNSVPAAFFNFTVEGNATGATNVTIGTKTGTGIDARGTAGITFVGNSSYDWKIQQGVANITTSNFYGCTYEKITGDIWNAGNPNEMISPYITECTTLFQNAGYLIDAKIVDSVDTLYGAQLNSIARCLGISCTGSVAHGLYYTTPLTSFTLPNIVSTGNTTSDVAVNNASNVAITEAASSDIGVAANIGAGTVTLIPAAAPVEITVLDNLTGSAIGTSSHVLLLKDSDKSQIINLATDASGIVTHNYTGTVPVAVVGWARDFSGSGSDYVQKDFSGTITASGFTLTVRLDPI